MVIPAVMLVILAFVVIRSLMGVVAREDVSAPISFAAGSTPAAGVWDEDARSFLLPATADHIDLEQSHDVEANAS
jgi:hypothetical protein